MGGNNIDRQVGRQMRDRFEKPHFKNIYFDSEAILIIHGLNLFLRMDFRLRVKENCQY